MEQPDLLEDARRRRDAGIDAAVSHADAVTPKWSDQAFDFLRCYLETHPAFTTEDVREAANGIVPEPPDRRAWGGITQRAVKAGLIARQGFTPAKDPKVHCNMVSLWRSRVAA